MRRIGVVVVSIVLIFALIAVLTGCVERRNYGGESRSLKIGLMPDIGMFPLLVAQEEGYFANRGLDVELLVFKSAKDRDTALQAGELDGALSDLLAVYFLKSNGVKVRATSITESRFLLLAAPNSGIQKIEDLKDVEIGMSVNTVIEYIVDSMVIEKLVEAGVTTEAKVSKGSVPRKMSVPQVPVRMELLRSGQLKAAALPDPLATVLTKSGSVVLADSRQKQMNPAVLIFTENALNHRADAIADLYQAYNQGVEAINEDSEKYCHLLVEKGSFPAEVIDDIQIPIFTPAEQPKFEEVTKILEWVKRKKLGNDAVTLTYHDLVETDLLK